MLHRGAAAAVLLRVARGRCLLLANVRSNRAIAIGIERVHRFHYGAVAIARLVARPQYIAWNFLIKSRDIKKLKIKK